MPKDFLFTSESVNEGHPDKVCAQAANASTGKQTDGASVRAGGTP